MKVLKIKFITEEQTEHNELEDLCLLSQLIQYIRIIGLREFDKEISCNNEKGALYGKVA